MTTGNVQILNSILIKLLKRQLKTLDRLSVQLSNEIIIDSAVPDISRIYRDIVAARVSVRTALRNRTEDI